MNPIQQGSMSYPEREAKKQRAYAAHDAGQISDLKFFEEISEAWWHRQDNTISLYDYCCHLSRAQKLNGETMAPEVLTKYPPATGKLKIAPGGSDFDQVPGGMESVCGSRRDSGGEMSVMNIVSWHSSII